MLHGSDASAGTEDGVGGSFESSLSHKDVTLMYEQHDCAYVYIQTQKYIKAVSCHFLLPGAFLIQPPCHQQGMCDSFIVHCSTTDAL